MSDETPVEDITPHHAFAVQFLDSGLDNASVSGVRIVCPLCVGDEWAAASQPEHTVKVFHHNTSISDDSARCARCNILISQGIRASHEAIEAYEEHRRRQN